MSLHETAKSTLFGILPTTHAASASRQRHADHAARPPNFRLLLPAFRFRHFAFLISHFAFFLMPIHAKPEKETPVTPSFAKPVKAVVFTDGEVEIPLLANAAVRGTKYLIRSVPKQGVLGEIVVTEDGHASITYTHNPRFGTGTDSFSYAAQTPGAAVSSRATVSLLVINRPPKVSGPQAVNFGVVPMGTSNSQVVTFRNSGGEKYSGRLLLASPWQTDAVLVEIEPGRSADVPITFSPDAERAYAGTWYLEGDGGTSGQLHGTGFVVFEVSQSFLSLQLDADGARSGSLTISNKTAESVELEFVCPTEIQQIPPAKIAPAAQLKLVVSVLPTHQPGGRVLLVVKEKRTSQPVEILFPPTPAKIALPTGIDFGQIEPSKTASREVTLTNNGGTPAAVEAHPPGWIRVDPARFLIKPGDEKQVRIEATSARPGEFRDRILFKYDGKSVEMTVKASLTSAPEPAPTQAASPPPPPAVNLTETQRKALKIGGIFQEKGYVTIAWQDPNPDPRTYRIESLKITSKASLAREAALAPDVGLEKFSPDQFAAERLKLAKLFEETSKNNEVVKNWAALEKVDIRGTGQRSFEAVFPVPPNLPVMRIRLSSVLADGSVSPVQTEIRIPLQQPPARQWPTATILWSLAALAAAAILIRIFLNR